MTQTPRSHTSATRCQVSEPSKPPFSVLTGCTGLQVDQDSLSRKNEELTQALREKSRKLMQIQELYDKLKRRTLLGHVQDAAHDAVDDTIQASSTVNRCVDGVGTQNQRPASHSAFQSGYNGNIQKPTPGLSTGAHMCPPPINRGGNADCTWSGFSSQGSVTRTCYNQRPLN